MKVFRIIALGLALLAPVGEAVAAPVTTPYSTVKMYLIGYYTPDLLVQLNAATLNPDNCPSSDLYIVAYTSPLLQSVTAAVMSAEATGRPVRLIIDGCYGNRPQIVGIAVGTS